MRTSSDSPAIRRLLPLLPQALQARFAAGSLRPPRCRAAVVVVVPAAPAAPTVTRAVIVVLRKRERAALCVAASSSSKLPAAAAMVCAARLRFPRERVLDATSAGVRHHVVSSMNQLAITIKRMQLRPGVKSNRSRSPSYTVPAYEQRFF